MMNLNNTQSILDTILNLIDPTNLHNIIDEPLDQSLQNFSYTLPDKILHREFNGILGNFYKYVSRNGLDIDRELTDSEAFEEVSWLLEKYYHGYETHGYVGAFFDAFNGDNERILFILEQIVEILKRLGRRKFMSWLINSHIDPLDWNFKVQIVMDILNNYGHLFHPDIRELSPTQLVPHIEELISILADSVVPLSSPFS